MMDRLNIANNLKHNLVSRQINTALTNASLAQTMFPQSTLVDKIEVQVQLLAAKIKLMPEYKEVMLSVQELLEEINIRG